MTGWSADEATEFLELKLGQAKSADARPRLVVKRPCWEIVPGTVFQALVEYQHYGTCSVRLYCGLASVLGQTLWLQDAQSLVRLNSTRHPALPSIVDGIFWDGDNAGIVITKATGEILSEEDALFLREKPELAYRYFSLLTDALRTLHDHGLVHRDLWRGSVELFRDDADANRKRPPSIRLVGFELSAFTASLADPTWRVEPDDRERLREARRRGGHERVAARAPEVLASEEESGSEGLSYRSDVFSLGVLGFQWFVEDLPPEIDGEPVGRSPEAVATWIQRRLAQAHHVSEDLRALLASMVHVDTRTRPTAHQVINALAALDERLAFVWSREELKHPYLVALTPRTMRQNINIEEWKRFSQDDGLFFESVRIEIEKDLTNCIFVHEPRGASPYLQQGSPERRASSTWVLIGKRAVYFCAQFVAQQGLAQRPRPLSWLVHINYIVDRGWREVREIGSVPLRRRIRRINVVNAVDAPEAQQRDRGSHPDWQPLMDEVFVRQDDTGEWLPSFRKGFEWWLKYQRGWLDIRQYAFRRLPPKRGMLPEPGVFHLELDAERDRDWMEADDLRYLLSRTPKERPDFGNFFGTLRERDAGTYVSWQQKPGSSSSGTTKTRARVVKRVSATEIQLKVEEGPPPLETGWLRPADDIPSDIQLRRQGFATASLFNRPQLVGALYEPWGILGPRERWATAIASAERSAKVPPLRGSARNIVVDLLAYFPFYALQGPPGTGKTTVVARAVAAYVNEKPGARVLVAAQSHYALDELAERIITLLDARRRTDLVVLRVASEYSEERVRPSIQDFFDVEQVKTRVKLMKALHRDHLSRPDWEDRPHGLKKLAGEWIAALDKNKWEVHDRIWKGANVVFATCGSSTENALGLQDGYDTFDWVIVEEAAKAWPAELAMPLVLGHRWTLIGDHKQLPPYGDVEISRIYDACANSPHPDVRELVANDAGFESTLDLFRHFFEDLKTGAPRPRASGRRNDEDWSPRAFPIDRLSMQFRMDDRILKIVREAFYGGDLESAPELCVTTPLHDLRAPAELRSRAVVWLDTGLLTACADEVGYWENRGEAQLVANLLNAMKPPPWTASGKSNPLAVLSPYNQQIHLIKSLAKHELSPYVATTDAFQGREADIVVVSLVRTNDKPPEDPRARIGHVASPQRTNVLLSRARHLLIIVGDFNHFYDTAGTPWQTVCRLIAEAKARVELQDGRVFS